MLLLIDEFRYDQTWKIWPSSLSLSLYSTFKDTLTEDFRLQMPFLHQVCAYSSLLSLSLLGHSNSKTLKFQWNILVQIMRFCFQSWMLLLLTVKSIPCIGYKLSDGKAPRNWRFEKCMSFRFLWLWFGEIYWRKKTVHEGAHPTTTILKVSFFEKLYIHFIH